VDDKLCSPRNPPACRHDRSMPSDTLLTSSPQMLVKTQIFSRMSPDEKNEVVERLQTLGYTVLMCGDGAMTAQLSKQQMLVLHCPRPKLVWLLNSPPIPTISAV
jgi:hypothetical protein